MARSSQKENYIVKTLNGMAYGFIASLISSEWVGLTNFEFLFKTPDALIILRNTV